MKSLYKENKLNHDKFSMTNINVNFFELSKKALAICDQAGNFLELNNSWKSTFNHFKNLTEIDADIILNNEDQRITIKINYEYFSFDIQFIDSEKIYLIFAKNTTKEITEINYLKKLNEILNETSIISTTDIKGNILSVNQNFCNISGYEENELIGKNHRIINSGLHSTSFFKNMWETVLAKKMWTGEVRNQKKNGEFYWVKSYVAPIVNEKNEVEKIVSVREDITDQINFEIQLKKNSSWQKAVLDGSNFSIIATDEHGIIQSFNKGAEKILGMKANDMIGKQTPAIIHDFNEIIAHNHKISSELNIPIEPGFRTFVTKAEVSGIDTNEWTYITKDKKRIPVKLSVTVLRDHNQRIFGYLGIAEDLSHQKSFELKWQQLLNLVPVGVFETNNLGECVFANQQWYKYTELSQKDAQGLGWMKAIHEEDREKVYYEWGESVKDDKDFYLEYRIQTPAGKLLWVIGKSISIKNTDGTNLGYLCTVQDITSLKSIQEELKIEKQKADIANAQKSIFLSSMSHEIRTPLNGIIGMFELLKDTNLTDIQKEYINTAMTSGDLLLGLINDILDLSKIEAGKLLLDLSATNVNQMVDDTLKVLNTKAASKNIILKSNLLPENLRNWHIDQLRVKQIIFNLLGNAIKFTEKGEVNIEIALWENKGISFKITDTGVGISEDNLKNLFSNFVQANQSIQSKYGGTGLGLSISKKLAELMEGTIVVESTLNVGSTFTVYIKANPAIIKNETDVNQIIINEDMDFSHFHILIVEDNKINQTVITKFLNKTKINYLIAENGLEAIEMIQNNQFDLILMDCLMPIMDGYSATLKIRESNSTLPIIALTANAMIEDKNKCISVGMNDFLPKPINKNDLYMTLNRWLKKGA